MSTLADKRAEALKRMEQWGVKPLLHPDFSPCRKNNEARPLYLGLQRHKMPRQ